MSAASGRAAAQSAPPPIQDNSFLVEEAYNQERGVVQHISTLSAAANSSAWLFTFTQEWPVGGRRHQLSYVIPLAHGDAASGDAIGLGDIALNYRYQVRADHVSAVAIAPRVSLLLPTGEYRRGLGAGGAGAQVNLPVSIELPLGLVSHSNAGVIWTPHARAAGGGHGAVGGYTLAQSVVWLAHRRVNLLAEGVWSRFQALEAGRPRWHESAVVSPGVRAAIDFPSGLQVVPGVGVPLGVGSRRRERSVFLYLSLEHRFARTPDRSGALTPSSPSSRGRRRA